MAGTKPKPKTATPRKATTKKGKAEPAPSKAAGKVKPKASAVVAPQGMEQMLQRHRHLHSRGLTLSARRLPLRYHPGCFYQDRTVNTNRP